MEAQEQWDFRNNRNQAIKDDQNTVSPSHPISVSPCHLYSLKLTSTWQEVWQVAAKPNFYTHSITVCRRAPECWYTEVLGKDLIGLVWVRCPLLDQPATSTGIE